MPLTPTLAVSALGAFQLTRDGVPAPKFKYLDARELFVFLLLDTTRSGDAAKSKQEIGIALWGDLSDVQLNARFKARLNDVRRVLGDRAWVVFENETYRFDAARGVSFDAHEFATACAGAEAHLRTGEKDNEHAAWQRAVSLYRGDFLQDYHTRSQKELYGEREWYLVVREELQIKYRRALERLTQLELDLGHADVAIELLRKRVTLDEYDDRAHEQLMFELALRGKRSQALRHYHNLVKQRADTAPDAELAALYEKIKRSEPLSDRKPADAASAPQTFADAAKLPPPFQVPADLPRFVGRVTQFDTLRQEILRASNDPAAQTAAPPLCLVGMGGIGKTSLAIHTAYRLREQFPDGVLWGNLRESEPLAILASWERAFGCDFSGLPDLNARAASLRSLLHEKKVLVLLDDVLDAADARPLLLNGAHTRTVFTSRSAEIAAALGSFLIEMPVLDVDESADLLTRIVGHARLAGQEAYAQAICEMLGHLPLALDITAHRLVSRPHWTLREIADRLRAQMHRLDELQLADRAVRATFALSWDVLEDAQQKVLAHVGIFQARSFTAAALGYVAEQPENRARDLLDGLVALSLLAFETNTRYRQHPLLADFSLEKLETLFESDPNTHSQQSAISNQQSPAYSRLSDFYLQFATENRRRYLALEEEWDNLNVGIEIADTQGMWQAVIDYGDVLTDEWFARGRITDARRNYPSIMRAARELEEQDPYIAATLNWGRACIEQGDYPEAEEHLQHGLQTSREVGDEYGIASGLFFLARIAVQRSESERAQAYLEQSQLLREKLGDHAGVAQALHLQARIRLQLYDEEGTIRLAQAALDILQELPPQHDLIVTYRLLALASSYLHQAERAREYMDQALALCDELQDFGEYAPISYELALMEHEAGHLETAQEWAESSLKLMKQFGERKGQAFLHKLLSRIAFGREDYSLAKQEAAIALELLQDLQDAANTASIFLLLGDIEKTTNQIGSAKTYWMQVITSAPPNHPIVNLARERLEQL